ncbi:MAG TPA: hypothetical protein VJC21_02700 [Candidatus Nanoarchaeia archaeon]|nr:hypothetical protein [Candidatus Nanoarchaeia archaeon]
MEEQCPRGKNVSSNRRGMVIGMVFVYILVGITFALVLIFGYQAISGFLQSSEEVAFVQFKTDLENSIKRLSTEYGSVRIEVYTTPLGYEKVCFVDLGYENIPGEIQDLCEQDQYACAVWEDAAEAQQEALSQGKDPRAAGHEDVAENVFLQPLGPVKIKVSPIRFADKGFHCENVVQGTFTLRLEGLGASTKISPIESPAEP